MHCNQNLYVSWYGSKEALDSFLGKVPPDSWYASPRTAKKMTLTNKSPTNYIPDMFYEARKALIPSYSEEVLHNPFAVWLGIILLKYCTWNFLKEGQYRTVKPP